MLKKLLCAVLISATLMGALMSPASAARRQGASTSVATDGCLMHGQAWREGGYIDAVATPQGGGIYTPHACTGAGIKVYWSDTSSGRPRTYTRSAWDTRGFVSANVEFTLSNSQVYAIRVYGRGDNNVWKSAYTSNWYNI